MGGWSGEWPLERRSKWTGSLIDTIYRCPLNTHPLNPARPDDVVKEDVCVCTFFLFVVVVALQNDVVFLL